MVLNLRLATTNLRYFSPEDAYVQVVPLYNAARLAHNLDNCEAFGLEKGCDIFNEDNFAVVIELAPHYLTFKFLSICDYYCAPEAKAEFSQYGEIGNSEVVLCPYGTPIEAYPLMIHRASRIQTVYISTKWLLPLEASWMKQSRD